jgi:hypothetical protein
LCMALLGVPSTVSEEYAGLLLRCRERHAAGVGDK